MTWTSYCALMGWLPPPDGGPNDGAEDPDQRASITTLFHENKIRMHYCGTSSRRAASDRNALDQIERWDEKPMVAVSWQAAEEVARRLSSEHVEYRLPTESEWEKAARGGLIGARWSWGDERPDASRCDCAHLGLPVIAPPRSLPANGYGLHGMCGGVWEWTADEYDALAYLTATGGAPAPSSNRVFERLRRFLSQTRSTTTSRARVLRGGSWADDAEACTVSFRMSRSSSSWQQGRGGHWSPMIGFRLCRCEKTVAR